ncbi:ABC transporter permease [Pedobacter sp. MC2016-24]|uniref:ABC transporter permease n=1 Tax=Pedobacter sp. MC2016-24 TaxID=2780090 RepID=UPI00187ED7BC|nr:ABC transporter permease [Pedobacter sp. MC2016-24]MBE9602761.1 ABC transporter permease [Pedobacter sp. MC2016-24]
MFKLNLKMAWRNLWKNKGFTLINVGGLAIGLASCMLLLLYVAYEWGYDKQFSGYEKTYIVYNNSTTPNEVFTWKWTPGVMAREIREKMPGVAHVSRSSFPEEKLISYGQKTLKKNVVFADTAFLKILDYKFIKGNADKALLDVNTIILTEKTAKILFGNEDPINKTVKLENLEALKVEGVIEDVPLNSTIQFDYLLPWTLLERRDAGVRNSDWGNNFCLTLIQLQDNNRLAQISAEMKGIFKRNDKGTNADAFLHPLTKWHLYSNFENGKSVGGKINQIRIFFTLAFCILLIACVNFMNLSTARSEKRAKEVGVRKAIGSSRYALIGQFMLESMLLSLIGMVLAFILMEMCLPYFNGLLNINLMINYGDWKFWSVFIALTLLTGFIAGSYPAFYLSSFEPLKVLKGAGQKAGRVSLSVREILVVFQFVFAACLIICTTVIYQQLNYIKNKPIGYNKAGLVEIPIQGNLKSESRLALLKDRLLKTGAIANLSYFSMNLNETGHSTFGIGWQGKDPNSAVLFNYRAAGYDFAQTIGTSIVAGRAFLPQFNDSLTLIVNEAAVKTMGLKQPLGAVIRLWHKQMTIIGVIKDFVMESPYQKAAPMVLSYDMAAVRNIVLRLDPSQNISASVNKIDAVIKELNPEFPVDLKFVDAEFSQKFNDEQLLGTLANWFGGFAVFISCLGLLGLALFIAEQRKKEMSIRKVLGASTLNVLTLLNRDFIKLVSIANLIAFPLGYIIINTWLSAYEFRVSISALPFALAIGLSVLIAVLTVSLQSFKVARSNPIDALKYE